MRNKLFTSIEQARELARLNFRQSECDVAYSDDGAIYMAEKEEIEDADCLCGFSLARLLQLLPSIIKSDKWCADTYHVAKTAEWVVKFINPYTDEALVERRAEQLLDAIYEIIIWSTNYKTM